MTRKMFFLVCFVFFLCIFYFPKSSYAFSCTTNGVQIGGAGTFDVSADVVMTKIESGGNGSIIIDLSQSVYCSGNPSYSDALKVTSAVLASSLTSFGYTGFLILRDSSSINSFPATGLCVWPDSKCSTSFSSSAIPLYVKIGLYQPKQQSGGAVILRAGSTIATLNVQQRSMSAWGWNKTWNIKLKNDISLPVFTCNITTYDNQVNLPAVTVQGVTHQGVGRHVESETPFNINLSCEKDTTVSIKFDGDSLQGTTDVLKNIASGSNEAVGIQVWSVSLNRAMKLGEVIEMISRANAAETLAFKAYYYYNGGNVSGGKVKAKSVFTLYYE